MRPNSRAASGSRLMLLLLMSTPLLSGCANTTELFRFLGGSETKTTVKIECPQLANPPDEVLDALATVKADPEAARWIVGLDRHYQKLDQCRPT